MTENSGNVIKVNFPKKESAQSNSPASPEGADVIPFPERKSANVDSLSEFESTLALLEDAIGKLAADIIQARREGKVNDARKVQSEHSEQWTGFQSEYEQLLKDIQRYTSLDEISPSESKHILDIVKAAEFLSTASFVSDEKRQVLLKEMGVLHAVVRSLSQSVT